MTDANKAALDALERLLNDALSFRDGYGSSRNDAELIRPFLTPAANTGDGPTVRYKNSLSEKEYPDHDLTTGALAALSNLMILSNADTATFEIENDVDGRFVFKATRTKPSAALQRPEPSEGDDTSAAYFDRIINTAKPTEYRDAKHVDALFPVWLIEEIKTALAPRQVDEWQPIDGLDEAITAAHAYLHHGEEHGYSWEQHGKILQAARLYRNLLAAAPTQDTKGE